MWRLLLVTEAAAFVPRRVPCAISAESSMQIIVRHDDARSLFASALQYGAPFYSHPSGTFAIVLVSDWLLLAF